MNEDLEEDQAKKTVFNTTQNQKVQRATNTIINSKSSAKIMIWNEQF
jgi:hypothetical protein